MYIFSEYIEVETNFNFARGRSSSTPVLTVTYYGSINTNYTTNVLQINFKNKLGAVWRKVFEADYTCLNKKYKRLFGNKCFSFLDILSQNIPGCKRQNDVQVAVDTILDRYNPTILVLGEVDVDRVESCSFPNYNLVKGKLTRAKKTRVCMLIKVGCKYTEVDYTCNVPTVTVKLFNTITVMGVYREWTTMSGDELDQDKNFNTWVKKVEEHLPANSIIIGDMNIDLNKRNQGNQHYKRVEKMRTKLLTLTEDLDLLQLISSNTRHMKNQSPSLLDHVWTDMGGKVDRLFNKEVVDSDHHLVGVRLDWHHSIRTTKITYRPFNKLDVGEFTRRFVCSNIFEIYQCADVNLAVHLLNKKVTTILDELVPPKTITIGGKNAPWMTEELRDDIKKRNVLHKKAFASGSDEDWKNFRTFRNQLSTRLKAAKSKQMTDHMNHEDSKTRWNRVKRFSGLDKKAGAEKLVIRTEKGLVSNPPEVADIMNKFFVEKITKLKQRTSPNKSEALKYMKLYLSEQGLNTGESFSFRCVEWDEVWSCIMDLSNNIVVSNIFRAYIDITRERHRSEMNCDDMLQV